MRIYDGLSADDRNSIARRYVEATEHWLRNLVDFQLSGGQYISNGPFKNSVKSMVNSIIANSGGGITREVDATTFEQLIYIVCHTSTWPIVSPGLIGAYPNGADEARTFLERIKDIRNHIAHGHYCSTRQLEKAVCYSNDVVDCIKEYFAMKNSNKDFNVPTFVKFMDNHGNQLNISADAIYYYHPYNLSTPAHKKLHSGDQLIVEVEVDPTFDSAHYEVEWILKTKPRGGGRGCVATIDLTNEHVGGRLEVQFKIKTFNDWHKGGDCDDCIDFYYTVLPPI